MKNLNSDLLRRSFRQTLILKREELSYTQQVMAEKSAITLKEYSNLELGKCLPKFQTLVNMAIAFNIDLNLYISSVIELGYVVMDKDI